MEYYLVVKKKKHEILPSATTWMDLEGIRLIEIIQRKTNIIHRRNLKKKTSEYYKKETISKI